MAYAFDPYDKALVINGFEKGIADSPHQGIANLQCVNTTTIPGEVSVGFSTTKASSPTVTNASVTSVSSNTLTFTGGTGLENGMAISFSQTGTTGLGTNTVYWVQSASGSPTTSCKLYSDFAQTSPVSISASSSGTFSSFNMNAPRYFAQSNLSARNSSGQNYFLIDSAGRVWTDLHTTTSGFWEYMGNSVGGSGATGAQSEGHGNGLVYVVGQTSTGGTQTGYLFVFRNSQIDYAADDGTSTWVYGWNPADGTINNNGGYLTTPVGTNNPHEALFGLDSTTYFCDANAIITFFQKNGATAFAPQTPSTYTYLAFYLLPTSDTAQCISFYSSNLMIGGMKNIIYAWDRSSPNVSYYLQLAEQNVAKMVTVNTNLFIFCGTRGRIYISNGSQAQVYKKLPDHISGTIEPYFVWGGATFNKNSLYFSAYSITNAGLTNAFYGGVWVINLETQALRLSNQLSYGTYDGYATALWPKAGDVSGFGIIMGWVSAVVNNVPTTTAGGLDLGSSSPYTGSQAVIESDLIPIGTFNKPRDTTQIEFKLSKPLVAGESITLSTRTDFNQSYVNLPFSTTPTTGDISGSGGANFKNAQWLQIKAVLNSTNTNPSNVRLKEIRITGIT